MALMLLKKKILNGNVNVIIRRRREHGITKQNKMVFTFALKTLIHFSNKFFFNMRLALCVIRNRKYERKNRILFVYKSSLYL